LRAELFWEKCSNLLPLAAVLPEAVQVPALPVPGIMEEDRAIMITLPPPTYIRLVGMRSRFIAMTRRQEDWKSFKRSA
jgi:hypothetical protein